MTTDVIRREQQKIIEEINMIRLKNSNVRPISDGIIDIDRYLDSDLKILWINKEVNSTEEDADWNLRDVLSNLRAGDGVVKGWAGTFNPIIYTVYGILNNKYWKDIPDTWVDPSIIDCLKQIAYINVKKIPGGAVADRSALIDYHQAHGSILEKQISLFNPDVIICGGTYAIIEDSLYKLYDKNKKLTFKIDNKNRNTVQFKNKEILIIDAHHPNSTHENKEKYCDAIIDAVFKWDKERA